MSVDALLLIADRLEASVRRRFLSAIQRLRGRIDLDGIVVDIAAGNVDRALLRLDVEALTDDLRDAATVLIDGFQRAGVATADAVNLKFRTSIAFDVTNPYAVAAARQLAARLVTNISEQTQAAIRDAVTRAFEEGLTRREVSRLIKPLIGLTPRDAQAVLTFRAALEKEGLRTDLVLQKSAAYAERKLRERARTIARTELMQASNRGQQALWQQAIGRGLLPPDAKRRWLVTRDDRICPRCLAMSGQTVGMNEDFVSPLDGTRVRQPPLHPNCLPGDSLVLPGSRVTGASKRRFDGDVIVVRVASGRELTCTPNHPILTPAGWLAARALHVGSDVVCDGRRQWRDIADRNHQQVPTRIQDVADAFLQAREVTAVPVPVAAEDFHGDGIGSEVAIVGADRELWYDGEASVAQPGGKRALVPSHGAACLPTSGAPTQVFDGAMHPAHCAMCRGDLPHALGRRHPTPFEQLGTAAAANWHLPFSESSVDYAARDAQLARKLVDGHAGAIFTDQVVNVQRVASRHEWVFNLETERGWYAADGIITHNCRCVVVLTRASLRGAA